MPFRRPQRENEWYSRSRRQWEAMSYSAKQTYSWIGELEETNKGEEDWENACRRCKEHGFTCIRFTAAEQKRRGLGKNCSRCRCNHMTCQSDEEERCQTSTASMPTPVPASLYLTEEDLLPKPHNQGPGEDLGQYVMLRARKRRASRSLSDADDDSDFQPGSIPASPSPTLTHPEYHTDYTTTNSTHRPAKPGTTRTTRMYDIYDFPSSEVAGGSDHGQEARTTTPLPAHDSEDYAELVEKIRALQRENELLRQQINIHGSQASSSMVEHGAIASDGGLAGDRRDESSRGNGKEGGEADRFARIEERLKSLENRQRYI